MLSKDITLETFSLDVTNLIKAEELSDVVLVGHSFADTTISGTPGLVPERIEHLVYLDALIVEGGKTDLMGFSAGAPEAFIKLADETRGGLSFPALSPSEFG